MSVRVALVGLELGFVVGLELGFAVGEAEGDELGLEEGLADGVPVGALLGEALGTMEGLADGAPVGALLGEALGTMDTEGVALGEALGDVVGGSVLRMHRLPKYSESSSRLSACRGKTPIYFAGLLSITHNAESLDTSEAAPTPIARRSTPSSVSAAISESYCVTASLFVQALGPLTQS